MNKILEGLGLSAGIAGILLGAIAVAVVVLIFGIGYGGAPTGEGIL